MVQKSNNLCEKQSYICSCCKKKETSKLDFVKEKCSISKNILEIVIKKSIWIICKTEEKTRKIKETK